RAVNLDQGIALAQLERDLAPSSPAEAVTATPKAEERTLSPRRLLIAVVALAAVAVIGRAMGGREPAFNRESQESSAAGSVRPDMALVGEPAADLPAVVQSSDRTAVTQTSDRTGAVQTFPPTLAPQGPGELRRGLAVAQGAEADRFAVGNAVIEPS